MIGIEITHEGWYVIKPKSNSLQYDKVLKKYF